VTRAALVALASMLFVAGCGDADEAGTPEATPLPSLPGPGPALQAADFPVLSSEDCAEVVEFYLEAIGGREYAQAALVWSDPVIDAVRLEAVFGSYREPQVAWTDPFVEGAAGSAFCTVSGTLTEARNPPQPPHEGTLLLWRANEVPDATPDQLRWTLQSSTFVERLERSRRGEP
jgi:hypothetical protein